MLPCPGTPPPIVRAVCQAVTHLPRRLRARGTAPLATAPPWVGAEPHAWLPSRGASRHGWGAAPRDSELGEDSAVPIPDERSQSPCGVGENTPERAQPGTHVSP